MKIKIIIKRILKKINFIITCKIPNLFFLIFVSPFIKRNIRKNGIKNVKEFKFKYWHFGYCYYVGLYNEKKVFIKYNFNKKLIDHEISNMKYIVENSKMLERKIPKLFLSGYCCNGAYLVEEFWDYNNLEDTINMNKKLNLEKIYEDFLLIIKEFQKIGFLHLDINPTNIYVFNDNEILFIDLGFSMTIKDNDINFIGNRKKQNFVINHLNKYSRIDVGYIDDAVSILTLSSYLCPEFITEYNKYWLQFNKLSGILYFDKKVKNEN